jgi:hypothetical protein
MTPVPALTGALVAASVPASRDPNVQKLDGANLALSTAMIAFASSASASCPTHHSDTASSPGRSAHPRISPTTTGARTTRASPRATSRRTSASSTRSRPSLPSSMRHRRRSRWPCARGLRFESGRGLRNEPDSGEYVHQIAVTVGEIRELAASLPRSYEAIVCGRVKFRIGSIVFLSLASDGSTMGCGFSK